MLRKPGKILLALSLLAGVSATLSGCLVKKKDPADVETIARATDSLRIYKPNDRIDYDITAVITSNNPPTTLQGVMQIKWEQTANLIDPIDGNTISSGVNPILKETTTITYDGSTQPDAIVIRYISQDANGKMVLHAVHDGTSFYWPYADGTTFPTTSPISTPVIFDSPLAIGTIPSNSGDAYVIAECSNNQCDQQIYKYRDDALDVVGDSTSKTTAVGIFSNPFQITYRGGTSPSNAPALSLLGDIRDACGNSNDTISHGENAGVGNLFVVPEIGVIKMENACQVSGISGATVLYTATLRSYSLP